jgi:hypothetical protein
VLRFQKQFRLGKNPLARLCAFCLAPGVVECGGLTRGPVLLGEYLRHPHALLRVDSRHRSQIAHGDLRGELALAHLLLNRLRQRFHQRQAARHPSGAAVETPSQIVDRAAELFFHLRQQPTLFERRFRLAVHAQGTNQHQRFGFAHLPDDGVNLVAAQLLQRGDALESVDDKIPLWLWDDDDGRLLTSLSQGCQQAAESRWVADPEVLQAAVQLMKLECLWHGVQYAPAGIWSFVVEWGCCPEPLSCQWDRSVTGLSRCAGVVCRQLQ